MRRILSAAAIALATLAVLPHAAAAQRRIVPFLGGGLATGTGDLSNGTDPGWIAFAGLDVPLAAAPGLSVGLTASHARVPYQGTFSESTSLSSIFAEAGYVIAARSSSIVKPFVRAGVGAQLRRYDAGNTGFRDQSEGRLAFGAGGGLQFTVGRTAIFVGAHFISDADAGIVAYHGGVAFPGTAK